MPTLPFPQPIRDLLAKPNPAVMASVRPDGQPVSVATWYLLDGDRVLLNVDATRKRLAHLRQDPRVSLTVLDEAGWYTHVSMLGRISEIVDDPDLADIDRLAVHYTGQPYPNRTGQRVTTWFEIDRWHTWGSSAAPK